MSITKKLSIIFITLGLNYLLDRIAKILVISFLPRNEIYSYFYNTIVIRYAENSGAFLSMGNNWPLFIKLFTFIIIPILVFIFVIGYCVKKDLPLTALLCLMSIVGGGMGNIQDRIFNNGFVVDFLNFGIGNIRTGILNIGDMSVTFGAIILMIYYMMKPEEKVLPSVDSNVAKDESSGTNL